MDACYTVNRKGNYFRVYNIETDFPLNMVQEFKSMYDLSYQEVANKLMQEDKENETQYLLNL